MGGALHWLLFLIWFALIHPNVARADMVVLRADGGGLAVGQAIATGAIVTLPAGASTTLIAEDGGTLTLNGPYTGMPDSAGTGAYDTTVMTALSRLLLQSEGDSSNLGATRVIPTRNPYGIDPAAGIHCHRDDRAPVFVRAMTVGTGHLVISASDGKEAKTAWATGVSEAPWPSDLTFADGTYQIRIGLRPEPVKLVVQKIPADIRGVAKVAVWMAEHGCQRQAVAILHGLL